MGSGNRTTTIAGRTKAVEIAFILLLAVTVLLSLGWGRRAQPRDLMFPGVCPASQVQRVYTSGVDPSGTTFEALVLGFEMPTKGCLRTNDAAWKLYGAACLPPGWRGTDVPTVSASPRASVVSGSGHPACSVRLNVAGQPVGPLP